MNISILFTIIFIIFYLILTIITIKERRSSKVAYGDDNNKKLIKAIRAHANFFEFTVFFYYFFISIRDFRCQSNIRFICEYCIFAWKNFSCLQYVKRKNII
jgi:uncharacterized membrane protein YecN with MAPEG domain